MRLTRRNAALIAMAVTALALAAAGAQTAPANYPSCGKDYSKNAATGDYCTTHPTFRARRSPLRPRSPRRPATTRLRHL